MVRIKYAFLVKVLALCFALWFAVSYLFSSSDQQLTEHEDKRMNNFFKKIQSNIEEHVKYSLLHSSYFDRNLYISLHT